MSKIALAIFASLALTGCGLGRQSEIFGRSYDECILKNASTGGSEASRQEASTICQRHFVRAPTNAEKKLIRVGSSLETFYSSQGELLRNEVIATARNNSQDFVVVEIETTLEFYDRPPGPDGTFAPEDYNTSLVWNLFPAALPSEIGSARGYFDGPTAPTQFYRPLTRVKLILPYK